MTDSNKIFFKFDNFDVNTKEYTVATKADIGFLRDKISNLPAGTKSGRLQGMGNGFRFSQVVESIIYYLEKNSHIKDADREKLVFQHISVNNDQPYIIAIAVQYTPYDWADWGVDGKKVLHKKSIFELLNFKYLQDLQNGKAMLLIDQSVEGYNTSWLWEWFHKKCLDYKINPESIIYLTGDQSCSDTYQEWCNLHNPGRKLKVIPSISLSIFVHKHIERYFLKFNFDELLKYKKENPDKIYLYDCLNRRARPQRVFNFMHLLKENLVNDGNITMPATSEWKDWLDWKDLKTLEKNGFGTNKVGFNSGKAVLTELEKPGILPRTANYKYDLDVSHYFSLVERVCDDLYKHSWVSLVVESSYYKREHSVFISEKSFKPIAAMQPFITVGSQHALKYIRKLGFKTFHPYIDESYDDAPDELRYGAIMDSLKKIKLIKDKAAWYESMRDIVEHNYNVFMNIGKERAKEHEEVMNHYFYYCNNYKNRT